MFVPVTILFGEVLFETMTSGSLVGFRNFETGRESEVETGRESEVGTWFGIFGGNKGVGKFVLWFVWYKPWSSEFGSGASVFGIFWFVTDVIGFEV